MAQTCPTCGSNNPAQRECLEPDCGQSQAHTKHNDCTDPFHGTPAAPETPPRKHECRFPTSGYTQHGTKWTCLGCGIIWEYCEDEAEGGFWESSGNVEAETPRKEEA